MSNEGRAVPSSNESKAAPGRQRIYWLDNLRTFAILLVVILHSGIVYESSGIGAIFWIVDDPATNDLVGIINVILDIFVMPTLFFISGYLAPLSLNNKTRWDFVRARFKRLMMPWVVAVFTLLPIYKVVFLYSRGLPQEHWTSYFHFSNGIWGQNWLWFLPVLFLFDLLYALLSSQRWVPTKMSFRSGLLLTFFISLATSMAFDMLNAEGWTKTALVDFQNERLLVYFMIFLLGSLGFHQGVFSRRPKSKKMYIVANATAWIPVGIYTVLLIIWLLNPSFVLISPLVGSFTFWLSLCVSMLCLVYLAIETFRLYFDRTGGLWNELSRNSYAVYIIHVIVLGALALLLLHTTIPSLAKSLTLSVSTYVTSNVIGSLARRAVSASILMPRAASARNA
jgi:fucose 4-O-acetylase-like acetyltransferase